MSLTKQTLQQLERLRAQTGKQSVAEVVADAIDVYTRIRRPEESAALDRLTPRMHQVLKMIGEAKSTKEIAQELDISVKTVEMHRTQLMKTLGIQGIASLVRFAIRTGVIRP